MAGARVFRVEFRIALARRIMNGESVSALSNELKIKRSVLYRWRDAGMGRNSASNTLALRAWRLRSFCAPVAAQASPQEDGRGV